MKRKKGFDKGIILIIIIILIVAATIVTLIFKLRSDKITEDIENNTTIKIAFIVTDEEKPLFTELFFYHPETHKGALLDIPNETGMLIESLQRIDAVDSVYTKNKEDEFIKTVEKLIDEEIPYHIIMDLEGVRHITDILEGLDMFVANPVEITDTEEPILIPSGSVTLDGDKTVTFITLNLEDLESDIENIGRKQKFLQSLLKKIGEKSNYLSNENIINMVIDNVETNLDKNSFLSLISEIAKMDAERIALLRTLGNQRTVDDKVLLFPHYDGRLVKETVNQTLESLANTELLSSEDLTVTLTILNGTDRNGLAGRTSQIYKSFGFDVVTIANADKEDYENTIVYDMRGDIAKAQKVANVISCNSVSNTTIEGKESLMSLTGSSEIESDVIIILGKDFDGRYCK